MTPKERSDLVAGLDDLAYMVHEWHCALRRHYFTYDQADIAFQETVASLVDGVVDPRAEEKVTVVNKLDDGSLTFDNAVLAAVLRLKHSNRLS